ncbi:hypothetical protein EW146_g3120 [Bondarzewia mesenterica]|uniref:Uncharacterized protein n=1 Tax=Bondarzewia mesenterica TaxID=1095465 RepID=A0A4V6S1I1_9AGAM|nr:hypothetical protein EW146_g3120 [Bondarzewia mesenterica]
MGFFPIFMNVLQFWLIDSIVKASTIPASVALPSESPRTSLTADRQPLFQASNSDSDDDSNPSRPPDLEAQRRPTRSRSHSADVKVNRRPSNDSEYKPSGSGSRAGTPVGADVVAMHAYPPSVSSRPGSPASIRALSKSPVPHARTRSSVGPGMSRKRRSPPPTSHPTLADAARH